MKRKTKYIIIGLIVIVLIAVLFYINASFSDVLENDARVAPESLLTYYIDVIYDGKDREVSVSGDDSLAKVYSDYIYVEDKLPEGLVFQKFVADSDIGAVTRGTGSACVGYVVDDSLVYDETTNKVSFSVKNLQAGCKLTVGIVTKTPKLTTARMDFYNTAFARERDFPVFSNTVHAFMGDTDDDEDVSGNKYSVTYKYSSDVAGAPSLPEAQTYLKGNTVSVAMSPVMSGYTFSGWSSSDVTVDSEKGTFVMPSKNVVFTGGFTKNKTYSVSYRVDGDIPDGYTIPSTKSYSEGEDVTVDSLKAGDVIDGYRFTGWTSNDAEFITDINSDTGLSSSIFTISNKNVEIVGSFERISYKVTYKFQGTDMPDNANELLPTEASYYPGDTVTVSDNVSASGYEFLGWYKDKTFIMPEEDVVIYGEWKILPTKFDLKISNTIDQYRPCYDKGEIVDFKIVVSNPNSNFSVSDVIVEMGLSGIEVVSSSNYTVDNNYVKIPTIKALGSIEILAKYKTSGTTLSKKVESYTNKVSVLGALANIDNYELTDDVISDTNSFKVSDIVLSVGVTDKDNNNLSGSEFSLTINGNDVSSDDKLNFRVLPDSAYTLKQSRVASGYVINKDTFSVVVDSDGNIKIDGEDYNNNNYVIVNQKINVLPNTGGPGIMYVMFLGVFIVVIGGLLYLYLLKHNLRGK